MKNLDLRSVGGRSTENHTGLSEIPETAVSTIATNTTTVTEILGDPYYKGIPLPRITRRFLI